MVLAAMVMLLMGACTPAKQYERKLRRELASGIRHDSLLMGITFGMTEDEFFDVCWELNRKKLVRQGDVNRSVKYDIEEELKYPATMDFYPVFRNGKIAEMMVRFIYNGWAPWNKELSARNLALDVKQWYESTYGNGFITVSHPKKGEAYTKIDGNRRITIYVENDLFVWAIFTDMLAEEEHEMIPDTSQN
jgi:hypothetical protein